MLKPIAKIICLLAIGLDLGFFSPQWCYGDAPQGSLQAVRDDVRNVPPPSPPSSDSHTPSASNDAASDVVDSILGSDEVRDPLLMAGAKVVGSPFWVPRIALGDSGFERYFPDYPYEDGRGYIGKFDPQDEKPWAVRVDADYGNNFDRVESVGGSMLFETSSRFGFEAQAHDFQERVSTIQRDRLWLGDANLVYRFAQNDWAEFRAGLGINWLADGDDANLGFNFSYAADIFPIKPFVLSSTIDAGTLGHAGLFRFRTTAGALFHGVEAYTGYECLEIERTHSNSFIAGLRLWF